MFVVALTEVAGDQEAGASALASLLGSSPYDIRLWLRGALPRIVFRSEARDPALSMLETLQSRGYGALLCDAATVTSTSQMIRVRRFLLDDLGMSANGPESEAIAWDDIQALIHVVIRTNLERVVREKEVVYTSRGTPATVERDRTSREQSSEHALYLICRDDAQPWCLLERDAQYLALAEQMAPTRRENFLRTMALIRSRAVRARFDDRFARVPMPVAKNVAVRGRGQPEVDGSQPREADLLVHVLALWLCRNEGNPYRAAGRD